MPRSSTLAETECAAPVNRRPPMSERLSTQQSSWLRPKNAVFAAVAAMTLYVLYHNERFLIEPENPIWKHYIEIACWLVPHAVAGTCALVLAPLQFSERLRKRYTRAHHIVGRLYVIGTLVLAHRQRCKNEGRRRRIPSRLDGQLMRGRKTCRSSASVALRDGPSTLRRRLSQRAMRGGVTHADDGTSTRTHRQPDAHQSCSRSSTPRLRNCSSCPARRFQPGHCGPGWR